MVLTMLLALLGTSSPMGAPLSWHHINLVLKFASSPSKIDWTSPSLVLMALRFSFQVLHPTMDSRPAVCRTTQKCQQTASEISARSIGMSLIRKSDDCCVLPILQANWTGTNFSNALGSPWPCSCHGWL